MLEKIVCKPCLHKLRVIHLIEADCNLSLTVKALLGSRLMWHCEENKAFHDVQGGSRPGRSTANVTPTQELGNDADERTRTNHASNANDAKACCDRMMATLTSLIDRFHGMPCKAVEVHAKAFDRACCCLKSKLGISDQCHTNTADDPVHGNGQGAGDSPNQWGMTSSVILDIHEHSATTARCISPDHSDATAVADSVFVDDADGCVNDLTNLLAPQQLLDLLKKRHDDVGWTSVGNRWPS